MNRYLFIILGSVGVLLLGVGVYVLFFSSPSQVQVVPTGTTFGTDGSTVSYGDTVGGGTSDTAAVQTVAPRLLRLSPGPVAYGTVVAKTTEAQEGRYEVEGTVATTSITLEVPEVRFIERVSGHVYSYKINDNTITRISNQTLPGIFSAVWSPDGSQAFVQYLSSGEGEVIETYALSVGDESGYLLETGLSEVITANNKLVTLLKSSTGSIASAANLDGTDVRTVFASPLSDIQLQAAGEDLVAYTNASASSEGYAFLVDGTSGTFTPIKGPLRGLTTLISPDGDTALISYRSGNALRLELFDMETRESVPLPITTLTEKCAWSADSAQVFCAVPRGLTNNLPDAWYQGAVSFSDRFWRVDVENRLASQVFDPEALAEVTIDGASLTVDTKEGVLVFVNRRDGSLWLYSL